MVSKYIFKLILISILILMFIINLFKKYLLDPPLPEDMSKIEESKLYYTRKNYYRDQVNIKTNIIFSSFRIFKLINYLFSYLFIIFLFF